MFIISLPQLIGFVRPKAIEIHESGAAHRLATNHKASGSGAFALANMTAEVPSYASKANIFLWLLISRPPLLSWMEKTRKLI